MTWQWRGEHEGVARECTLNVPMSVREAVLAMSHINQLAVRSVSENCTKDRLLSVSDDKNPRYRSESKVENKLRERFP